MLALSLVVVAILLGLAVHASGGVTRVDRALAAAAWRLRRPWLDEGMMALSGFGDGLPRWCVTIVVSAYLAATRRYRLAATLVVAMTAAAVLAPALKLIFHTARPSPLYAGPEVFSFPSGHAIAAATLYGVLGIVAAEGLPRAWRVLPLSLAGSIVALISLSRVYLGAHWFSDVLAGVALGSAIVVIAATLGRETDKWKSRLPGWCDGLAILACLSVVVAVAGPPAIAKGQRLYAPGLKRESVSSAPSGGPASSAASLMELGRHKQRL